MSLLPRDKYVRVRICVSQTCSTGQQQPRRPQNEGWRRSQSRSSLQASVTPDSDVCGGRASRRGRPTSSQSPAMLRCSSRNTIRCPGRAKLRRRLRHTQTLLAHRLRHYRLSGGSRGRHRRRQPYPTHHPQLSSVVGRKWTLLGRCHERLPQAPALVRSSVHLPAGPCRAPV